MRTNPTKQRPTDTYFSTFVKERDRKCVFKKKCKGYHLKDLQCCHFLGKGAHSEGVRFHPLNADAGCPECHEFIDHTAEGIKWHREFKLKQLGEDAYWELVILSNQYKAREDWRDKLNIKRLFETIK